MTVLRDRGLNTLFQPMESRLEQGGRLKKADITSLIDATSDGRGVSKTEAKDLERVLDNFGSNMTPAARRTLQEFLAGQSGAQTGPTLSGLQLRIRSAGLRNELTGASGRPSIIADKVVDQGEAQRLIGIVRKNGIVSQSEKKDIGAILDNPNLSISSAERQLLSDVIGRFVEPRGDGAVVMGSSVQSAHVDANKSYRSEGFSISALRQAGVPSNVISLLQRADALTGSGDQSGRPSITELANLENGAALLPAETAALGAAFALFEVGDAGSPKNAQPQSLDVADTSVRPQTLDLMPVEIDVTALPSNLRQVAQRARLVAQGAGADLSKVSLSDIEHATTNDLNQTTAADRSTMSNGLTDALKPLATDAIRGTFKASATIPDLGLESIASVDAGALQLSINVWTKMSGSRSQRGSWSVMEKSHQPGSRSNPARSIPKRSYTKATIENVIDLKVDIPPGHKLLLANVNGGTERVLDAGEHGGISPGDYRAVLMNGGEIVEEGALRVPRSSQKDVSDIVTFDLTTESGDAVNFDVTNGRSYLENFTARADGAGQSLHTGDPITLTPGRYEGTIATNRNQNENFILDVISENVMEAQIGGQKIQMYPVAGARNRYEGHLDDSGTSHQLLQFDARHNVMAILNESKRTYHGSSGWYADVRTTPRPNVQLTEDMLTG